MAVLTKTTKTVNERHLYSVNAKHDIIVADTNNVSPYEKWSKGGIDILQNGGVFFDEHRSHCTRDMQGANY